MMEEYKKELERDIEQRNEMMNTVRSWLADQDKLNRDR